MTSTNEYRGLAGTEFGRYRLDELIDRGGVGEVYRAFDSQRDRQVALKILAPKFAADDDFRERFRRESQLVAGMKNPHIVPIHDFGENDGRLYLDMRLIDGRDLGTVIREDGAMSPQRAVALLTQVASALSAAHGQGIVHRDVKPTNILTAPTEVSGPFAYLADFGLARTVGGSGATRITVGDGTDGTLEYMAPERFGSGPIDWRVDIYSLGCVLFECLTGRPAFPAAGIYETMNAHVTAPIPRPSEHASGIPTALDDVVTKAMAKRPEDRYETAGAFATACEEALAASAIPEQRRTDWYDKNDSSTRSAEQADTSKNTVDGGDTGARSTTASDTGGGGTSTQQSPTTGGFGAQTPPPWAMPPGNTYPPPTNGAGGYPPPAGIPPYTNSWPTPPYPQPRKTRWWIPVIVIVAVLALLFVFLVIVGIAADSSGPSNPSTPPSATPTAGATQTPAAAPPTAAPTSSLTLTQAFSVPENGNCLEQSGNLYPQETEELRCNPPSGGYTIYAAQYTGAADTYVQQMAPRYTNFSAVTHDDCGDSYAATGTDSTGTAVNTYLYVYKHSPFSVLLVSATESMDQLSQTRYFNSNPQAVCSGG